ncbi:DUF7009 family protein [Bryobacter aggregatus]|uniref:DUF7009 family protein n=1 Tax=Bryobacter aggregatus TaxID=360054 RepID=UPI0004E0EB44|nr:hypothetical protein [Bryobacter aggregatus]
MKLRLRANTIRLRLVRAEVEQLSTGQAIVETLSTPTPFHFQLAPTATDELRASFEQSTLTIEVPHAWAATWAASEEVGRSATSGGVSILIEKDWACTTPRSGEDDSDTYPNPVGLS